MTHSLAGRAAAGVLLSLLALVGVAPTATAKPDPGGSGAASSADLSEYCPLRRIDTQLVRCDSLTGAGVPAPPFIREYQPAGTGLR
jgi:hypothetical protein